MASQATSQAYYVIEHPGYGCYKGFDHSSYSGEWKPMFSWSVLRSDPSIKRFYSQEAATRELKKVRAHSNRYSTSYLVQVGLRGRPRSGNTVEGLSRSLTP